MRDIEGKLPEGASKLRAGDPRAGCTGRDTALLSLCWDDWELDRAREVVQQQMDRK